LTIQLTPSRIKQLRNKWYAEALANTKEVMERSAQDAQSDNLAPDDRYTAWFQLLGLLVSPKTSAEVAADAAYRISWYLPAVDDCRSAAARAALQKLTDDQILALLSAAGNLFAQLDGSPAEHVAGLLSYDEQAGERIAKMLSEGAIPSELAEVSIQIVEQLGETERPDLWELHRAEELPL
jgi:hypothetical protein